MIRYFDWLAGEHIAVHETALTAALPELFPAEKTGLKQAVPKRVREFAAGRFCARQCMEKLGLVPTAILTGADRRPLWPEGVTGSITHTNDHCAVVMARTSSGIVSIGIDLEPDDDLPAEILELVCGPDECGWLNRQQAGRAGLLAKVIFCAKECAYKAQYPLSRDMLEFHDFRVRLHLREEQFEVEFMRDAAPFTRGWRLHGRLRIANGGIACAIVNADR